MCHSRHGWGEYFRSNLDWDWDLGQAMNLLFDSNAESPMVMPRNARRTSYHLPIAIVDEVHGTMELTLGTMIMPGPSLNKIRVAYTGETGETHDFVTFVPALTADVRKIPENKYQELILTSEGMKNSDQHSKSQVGEHRSFLLVYWTSQGRNHIHYLYFLHRPDQFMYIARRGHKHYSTDHIGDKSRERKKKGGRSSFMLAT